MEEIMQAAVMKEKNKIVIEDIKIPQLKENEVLIKVKAVGVCGSDLHYYTEGKIGNIKVKPGYDGEYGEVMLKDTQKTLF